MKKIFVLLVVFLLGCTQELNYDEKIETHFKDHEFEKINSYHKDSVITFHSETEVGAVWFDNDGDLYKTLKTEKEYKIAVDVEVMTDDKMSVIALYILENDIFSDTDYALVTFLDSGIEPVIIEIGETYDMVWIGILDYCLSSCAIDKVELFNGNDVIYTEAFIPT